MYAETLGDNVKLKVFIVMSAAYGRHALTQLIQACPLKKSRNKTITESFSDRRSKYSSCSAQNRLADVERPGMTN